MTNHEQTTNKLNGWIDKVLAFTKKNRRSIMQGLLVVLCIGCIIYFMPKGNTAFNNYKEGSPWEYEQLVAEFSFDVPKTAKEIEEERDSIRENTPPVFRQLGAPSEFYSAAISTSFMGHVDIESRRPLFNNLKSLFEQGIIADSDTIYLPARNNSVISIYNSSGTHTTEIRNFTTTTEASASLQRHTQPTASDTIDAIDISTFIKPNFVCDTAATSLAIAKGVNAVDSTIRHIDEGKVIIRKDEIVDKITARAINTYIEQKEKLEKSQGKGNWLFMLLGQIIFIILCMLLLLAYIRQYKREIMENSNKFVFTILAATLYPVMVGFITSNAITSVFVLPFAIVPIMLCLFIDHNTAFVTNLITIAMCSIMVGSPYKFLLLQSIAGCSAILSLRDLSSRSQMFRCVITTFITYSVTYLCYELVTSSGLHNISYRMYTYLIVSSVLTLFTYPLMFIIEKTFGFISSVTLIELSNLNSKLLQRMSQEAPGTFQHSMQVGNLAAEAALAVGANPLEVRTGAMYHDIGKLYSPIIFTENQNGGISPHSKMTAIESAQAIIKHVTYGIEMAEHEKLPKKIIDFISTHHAAGKTGYFYITYKNEHPNEEIDELMFTYPGHKPTTKEQAILLMADCVEAASHSLKEHTETGISELVDKIIDSKVNDKELSLSPLTFQDIYTIKNVFKRRLMAIYHTRISYPKEKKQE